MPSDRMKFRVPFPGPRPYDEYLSDLFFGRGQEIKQFMDRVEGQRLSVLTAESASGKTSLLQAGLVPMLRESRLNRILEGESPLPPFPLLLNQWGVRGHSKGEKDYLSLFSKEILRYLGRCFEWYENRRDKFGSTVVDQEVNSIRTARDAVQKITDDTKAWLDRPQDRDVVGALLEILNALTTHLGSVLLILDQFEEILGDSALGWQALDAVESVFELCKRNVKQFLSLRNDSIHLLKPLSDKDLLVNKRSVSINTFDPEEVELVIKSICIKAEVGWESEKLLKRLIQTFTPFFDGRRRGEVNLIGLQVVLKELYVRLGDRDPKTFTCNDVMAYCNELRKEPLSGIQTVSCSDDQIISWLESYNPSHNPSSSFNQVDKILREYAPQAWITACLEGRGESGKAGLARIETAEIDSGQIKPIVMRLADWFVTPSGFKRPLSLKEIMEIGYRKETERRGLAGRARRELWSREKLDDILGNTCRDALDRLVSGHVLKRRGGQDDTTYELVHDQFGRPLQAWAATFKETPEADLGTPYEISDKEFRWNETLKDGRSVALKDWVTDGQLEATVWKGCVLRNVDFSGVNLKKCDFSRTLFVNCSFTDIRIDNCTFGNAKFENCTFDRASIIDCDFKSVAIEGGKISYSNLNNCALDLLQLDRSQEGAILLEGMRIYGGTMKSANLTGAKISDCTFEGKGGDKDSLLAMRYMQLGDSEFSGPLTFRYCSLDGATIGSHGNPVATSNMTFDGCDISGAELTGMHFSSGNLKIVDCLARGSAFKNVILPKSAEAGPRGDILNVDLSGAIFLGCELRDVVIKGPCDEKRAAGWMLCIRPLVTGDTITHSIVDNVCFINMDVKNIWLLKCRIDGPLLFDNCDLSGGTLEGDDTDDSSRIKGDIRFLNQCDLTAFEFKKVKVVDSAFFIEDGIAAGACFIEVTLRGGNGKEGISILRTHMPGVVFIDCSLHGVHFKGAPERRESIETLVIKSFPESPAKMGNCSFENLQMENFKIDRMLIDGDLTFSNCDLTGGTIGNPSSYEGDLIGAMQIDGDLVIRNGCDLSAMEFTNVRFADDAGIRVNGGNCRGALFNNVEVKGSAVEPGLLLEGVDLSGSVFLNCAIGYARLCGGKTANTLMHAWGLVIRGTDNVSRIESLIVDGYDCDGGTFENIVVGEQITFKDSSLLRVKISGVVPNHVGSKFDVSTSDLLFAEIDEKLIGNIPHDNDDAGTSGGILGIKTEQKRLAIAAGAERGNLRFHYKKICRGE